MRLGSVTASSYGPAGGPPSSAVAGRASANPLVHSVVMANIKSQIKRNRQNEKARQRNKDVRTSLKTASKKARTAASEGDADAALTQTRDASRAFDKAVAKGIVHKRTAARNKSRLARAVNRAGASGE
jgi:small subunit ribosomal protein S20